MPNVGSTAKYMPQLDGLRAIAVITVLIQHWGGNWITFSGFPIGGLGVGLFFVLSGFLITGILLDIKTRNLQDNGCGIFWIRQFWARRVLRIFPILYITILFGYIFQIPGVFDNWQWHVTYLTNFLLWLGGELSYASHFWTLAVEEQFYIIWPIIVIFAPTRHLPFITLMIIIISPIWRTNVLGLHNPEHIWALLPSQLDYLGMGALLSVVMKRPSIIQPRYFSQIIFIVGVVGFSFTHFAGMFGFIKQTFLAMIFCSLIYISSIGIKGVIGKILSSRPLVFIGKISYGIYILHMLAPFFWNWFLYTSPIPGYRIFLRLGIPEYIYNHFLFMLLFYIVFTLLFSTISWFFLERPILSLKRYFPYCKTSTDKK